MDVSREEYGITRFDAFLAFIAYLVLRFIVVDELRIQLCYLILGRFEKRYRDYRISRYICHRYYGFKVGSCTYGVLQLCKRNPKIESVGAFCSIGPSVSIAGFNHPLEYVSTHPFLWSRYYRLSERKRAEVVDRRSNQRVVIGNDVWIGEHVIILRSVKIGDGAVIGCGSIVTRDVEPYTVVAGVPAEEINTRLDENDADIMQQIEWWSWPRDEIKEKLHYFYDPKDFINQFGSNPNKP